MLQIQQIHGIDDKRAVGRILACRVAELLYWLDGVFKQMAFPSFHFLRGPVAIYPSYGNNAVESGIFGNIFQIRMGYVFGIYENGNTLECFRHERLHGLT
ncbi:MAG: hypothetical protein BWY20_02055 [Spirochaetes bacterium ADurb.Bin215]|nr:MAG: hypothetical protein BWY20_02055 [Spirochaetes bacterium ADurb.Bin215]